MFKRIKNTSKLLLLVMCCSCVATKITPAKKNSLKQHATILLDNWHKAAAKADFKAYFNALDASSVFVGTANEEVWSTKDFKAFSKPYFDKGKAWTFTPIKRHIYISEDGKYIWFDELLNTWMGVCRGSGVLQKQNNTLVIKHYVLSVTVPNSDIQKVIAAKKQNDSLFIATQKLN